MEDRVGKKPENVFHGNTETANVSMLSSCGEVCTAETDLRFFWIDNGGTRHITHCPEYFVDFTSFHSPCGIKAAGKETLATRIKANPTIDAYGECFRCQYLAINRFFWREMLCKVFFLFRRPRDAICY
ncbi:hypothetical protein AVEN_140138-1 [Araneus ventricosus]|uniref:Uncharacterized protein n=1 Tax=Araneus ventricosus TaxID=182803 RepID=A0A4Y2FVB9_ARAVE|nr:hypothetical protein AVEN_140138-1 [Araneus ventricosus]